MRNMYKITLLLCTFLLLFRLSGNAINLKLSEDIIIGKGDVIIPSIYSVCEDSNYNIHILSGSDGRVYSYTSKGEFIRNFGSKGEGPGEFKRPLSIYSCNNGNLIVSESGDYVSEFSTSGSFIRRINLSEICGTNLYQITYGGGDTFYGKINRENSRQQLVMIDIKKKKREDLPLSAKSAGISIKLNGKKMTFFLSSSSYSENFITSASRTASVYAHSGTPSICIRNIESHNSITVSLKEKPLRFSDSELEKKSKSIMKMKWPEPVKKQIVQKLPEKKNITRELFVTSTRIWVFLIKKDIYDEQEKFRAKIFTVEGKYIGEIYTEALPIHISDRSIYFSEEDEDEDLILKKQTYSIIL